MVHRRAWRYVFSATTRRFSMPGRAPRNGAECKGRTIIWSFTADDAQITLRRRYLIPHHDWDSPSALPLTLDADELSVYTNGQ
jgi:hypothetical protein